MQCNILNYWYFNQMLYNDKNKYEKIKWLIIKFIKFFAVIDDYLKVGGAFFFEIGFNQGKELLNICESFNIKNALIKKDLSGKDRFLICYNF